MAGLGEAEGLAAGGSSPFAARAGWLVIAKAISEKQATNFRAAMRVPPVRTTARRFAASLEPIKAIAWRKLRVCAP